MNKENDNGVTGNARRITYVVNVSWFFISHRLNLSRACVRLGWDVDLVAGGTSSTERELFDREAVNLIDMNIRRSGIAISDISFFWRLLSIFRRDRPDLVHLVTIKPVIFGGIAARIARTNAVVYAISGLGYTFIAAGWRSRIRRAVIIFLYRLALGHHNSLIVFQNRDDQDQFLSLGIATEEQCVLVQGSGVDTDTFCPKKTQADKPVVVLPARMLRDKGVIEFAKAAGELTARGLKAEFWLAGSVDENNPSSISNEELEELVVQYGVRWLGHVTDMANLFGQAHIVCLPSYREGLPKALAEAAAAGKPIVTTDVPGCREVVIDGENGFLVQKQSVAGLADALERLLTDSSLRDRMGENGRRMAIERWDVRKITERTIGLYKRLWA